MNPDAAQIWRAPRWALAVLLALLGQLSDTVMSRIERRALRWRDTFELRR